MQQEDNQIRESPSLSNPAGITKSSDSLVAIVVPPTLISSTQSSIQSFTEEVAKDIPLPNSLTKSSSILSIPEVGGAIVAERNESKRMSRRSSATPVGGKRKEEATLGASSITENQQRTQTPPLRKEKLAPLKGAARQVRDDKEVKNIPPPQPQPLSAATNIPLQLREVKSVSDITKDPLISMAATSPVKSASNSNLERPPPSPIIKKSSSILKTSASRSMGNLSSSSSPKFEKKATLLVKINDSNLDSTTATTFSQMLLQKKRADSIKDVNVDSDASTAPLLLTTSPKTKKKKKKQRDIGGSVDSALDSSNEGLSAVESGGSPNKSPSKKKKQNANERDKYYQDLEEKLDRITSEEPQSPSLKKNALSPKKSTTRKNAADEGSASPDAEKSPRKSSAHKLANDKIQEQHRNDFPLLFQALNKTASDFKNSITSIFIKKSDSLETERFVKHPLVQIHILDASTGAYLSKSEAARPVTNVREAAEIHYILPTITNPFNLKDHHTMTPEWNQEVVLNELYLHIVRPNVIVLFEILDFVTSTNSLVQYPDGWKRVAWAFLKPVGGNGKANTEKEARLQLFKYPFKLFPKLPKGPIPYVFYCWREQWRKYPSTLFVKIGAHRPLDKTAFPDDEAAKALSLDKKIGQENRGGALDTRNIDGQFKSLRNHILKPKWRRKEGEMCKLPNRILYRIEAGQRGSFSCSFSNNGLLLAVATVNQNSYPIKICQIDTGERIATLEGHQDLVYQIVWSTDDSQIISASSDGSVRIWTFMGDNTIRQTHILLHPTFVYCVAYHPTKLSPRYIATGSYDGKVRLWLDEPSLTTNQQSVPEIKLQGHKANVNAVCFNADGTRLYSGDGHGIIKVWSSESIQGTLNPSYSTLSYECIKTIDAVKSSPIQALRMHISNRKLAVQTLGPSLYMMDTRIHRILTSFELPAALRQEQLGKYSLASSSNMMSAMSSMDIRRGLENASGNTGGGKRLDSIHQISNAARFLKCTFSPCGTYLFVGSSVNGQVHFWRAESGTYLGAYSSQSLASWGVGGGQEGSSESVRTRSNIPVVDISFHPHDHIIAFSVWGEGEPIRVYTWDKKQPDIRINDQIDVPDAVFTSPTILGEGSGYGSHTGLSKQDALAIRGLDVEAIVSRSMNSIRNSTVAAAAVPS